MTVSTLTVVPEAPASGTAPAAEPTRSRPLLVDLFCKAGGAARGYHEAGFEVLGVDVAAQPRYPFRFVRADALEFLGGFDFTKVAAVHASPPCHDHSGLSARSGENGTGWMLPATRLLLGTLGLPYVIENVPGAPLRRDLVLCGAMFGLRTYRHRWFELGGWWTFNPGHPRHQVRTSSRERRRDWDAGLHVSVTGDVGTYLGREAMGIDWMTGDELSQAVPPAYTRYIGEQLLTHLRDNQAPRARTRVPL